MSLFIVAKQRRHLQTVDRHKIDKSDSRAKSKNAALNEGEVQGWSRARRQKQTGEERRQWRLKYPGRSQLNGHVRLIRAAETVKQAGGRKWKEERDVGSKAKMDGVRSAQNWGQNSSIYPLVRGSKD